MKSTAILFVMDSTLRKRNVTHACIKFLEKLIVKPATYWRYDVLNLASTVLQVKAEPDAPTTPHSKNSLITHADGGRGGRFYLRLSVCLSVSLHNISKTGTARITKVDKPQNCSTMSHANPFTLGSKVKVTSHKNVASMGCCTLASAGDF